MSELPSPVVAAVALARTPEERRDQQRSWDRPDRSFFASGACHILAFRFLARHPDEGFRLVHVQPDDGGRGDHVFATDDTWAFDFNGWVREQALVAANLAACLDLDPDWTCELVEVTGSLEEFCAEQVHRRPDQYVEDPTARADAYLDRWDRRPPA